MLRTPSFMGAVAALALLTACSSGSQAPVEAPQPAAPPAEETQPESTASTVLDEASTLDGIYTMAQAERGGVVFQELCAECHENEDLTETAFRGRWADQSTFQLWYYINDRMPYDNPWSLTRQQVTDVLTYILSLNGLPTGDAEMGTTDDDIDKYWIVWEH